MRLLWFRAIISCGEGEWLSIAKYLVKDILRSLRRFLLGEIENAHFRNGSNGLEVVCVLSLTQTRWHKFARLLIGRASYYRRWLQHQPECAELCRREISGLDRKALIGRGPYELQD